MANTSSAKKMVRKIEKRRLRAKGRRSQMRGFIRKVEEAIASGDKKSAVAALRVAQPVIARAAQKHVLHRRATSRKISRLSKRVNVLA